MTGMTGWEPHADAWFLVVVLLGGYLYALSAWGPEHAPGRPAATRRQRWCYYAGVATIWLAADWPVKVLADSLFSAHMAQHMVFSLVSAPLLLLGTPGWLLRKLLSPRPVNALARVVTRPMIAFLIFNTWIVLYHWPVVVNLSVSNDGFHLLAHIGWMVSSLIMWWPVLSPLPELPHMSSPGRMVYLFGQSIVPTVPASFLTFGDGLLYHAYAHAPTMFGVNPIDDQQIAGLLMKIAGGFLIWGVITVIFFRWSVDSESGAPDRLYWRDLEPELDRLAASNH
ncbi:MAG TPA: cytochrome c oxidase assembly protein [Egibacteraceae bacterium]|nr:cytochrome c oxidase assembly protein [Egibacteraceae bacterium]